MAEAAPLTSIPQAPVPPGGGAMWVTGARGEKLRVALFEPKGPARGSVVLSTGRTEAIEKYFEVIGELLDRGFVVLAQEWRGQGLSHRELDDRLKGHATGFQPFLDDYRAILAECEPRLPKPWIAIGHSMGGCLTLLALARGEAPRFAGCVLSAPMLGVRLPPMARALIGLNLLFGRRNAYARPPAADPYYEAFEGNVLTHDKARFDRWRAQIDANRDLALSAPTWGWLDFAVVATDYLAEPTNLRSVHLPLVIVSASDDQLVRDDAQKAIAQRLPNGRFVSVEGAEHEILMETDDKRAVFWAEFDALADQAAPKPAPAKSRAAPKPAAKAKSATPKPAVKAKPAAAPKPAAKAKAPAAKRTTKPKAKG